MRLVENTDGFCLVFAEMPRNYGEENIFNGLISISITNVAFEVIQFGVTRGLMVLKAAVLKAKLSTG